MSSQRFISSNETHVASGHLTEDKPKTIYATRMRRLIYVVWIVLLYAALVLFSWIVISKLMYWPIIMDHYGAHSSSYSEEIQAKYYRNKI